jgi:hypothetical protein
MVTARIVASSSTCSGGGFQGLQFRGWEVEFGCKVQGAGCRVKGSGVRFGNGV